MNKGTFIKITRIISGTLAALILVYVAFANSLPFGANASYEKSSAEIPAFTPPDRVEIVKENDVEITKQKDDLIYFTTSFPFKFESAKVKIVFRNQNPSQTVDIGYKDKEIWHYDTKILDNPLFHHPEFKAVGSTTLLYQKDQKFTSVDDFLSRHSNDTTIGTLDYTFSSTEGFSLGDYRPSSTTTSWNIPLRGSHSMFVYVGEEPFYLKITKQDLNWYQDPDVMTVRVYKDGNLVFTSVIDDDGITDDTRRLGAEETAIIKNPGPDLPEPGVYQVVFSGSYDTVLKNIETTHSKMIFAGPIYPISNQEVYPELVPTTTPTTLYTNIDKLTATTQHQEALQRIRVGTMTLSLTEANKPYAVTSPRDSHYITLPESDVILGGAGYFALNEKHFFIPNKHTVLPLTNSDDLELVDYVITPYSPPQTLSDGYKVVEREFDITSAVPQNGRLSWVIRAPGLKENGGEIVIRDIEITYSRKGWWKQQ